MLVESIFIVFSSLCLCSVLCRSQICSYYPDATICLPSTYVNMCGDNIILPSQAPRTSPLSLSLPLLLSLSHSLSLPSLSLCPLPFFLSLSLSAPLSGLIRRAQSREGGRGRCRCWMRAKSSCRLVTLELWNVMGGWRGGWKWRIKYSPGPSATKDRCVALPPRASRGCMGWLWKHWTCLCD